MAAISAPRMAARVSIRAGRASNSTTGCFGPTLGWQARTPCRQAVKRQVAAAKTVVQDRVSDLQMAVLGEELSRRAGRRCELCEGWRGGLEAYDTRAVGEEGEEESVPQLKNMLLLCKNCKTMTDLNAQGYKPRKIQFLKVAALSDVPIVRDTAVRLLEKATGEKMAPLVCGEECQTIWAKESLDFF